MQDRPDPHDQIQAPFVSILAFLTHVHPSPILVPFLYGSAGARSLSPHFTQGKYGPGVQGCCNCRDPEPSLGLLTVPSSLWPQGGAPGPFRPSEGGGRGCGWTHWCISSASLGSIYLKPLSLGTLPWALLPSPKFPVGLPRLYRAYGSVSPVHLFPPSLPYAPASWVRKRKAREFSWDAIHHSAQCRLLQA